MDYKARLFSAVVGVVACLALTLVGCAESQTTPKPCVKGQVLCDDTGASELICKEGADGKVAFVATACAAGTTCDPTSPVTWQVDNQRSASASYSVYFGNPTNRSYSDPGKAVKATLTSPQVTLPTGQGKLCVEFKMFKDTENSSLYDKLTLTLVDGTTKSVVWDSSKDANRSNTSGKFVTFAADVTIAAGKPVTLEFFFDSKDSIANTKEGVYLDDIRLLQNCTP